MARIEKKKEEGKYLRRKILGRGRKRRTEKEKEKNIWERID